MKPIMEYTVIPAKNFDKWAVNKKVTKEIRFSDMVYRGDYCRNKYPRYVNWDTWPARVVFTTDAAAGGIVRGEAWWRRSKLFIRMKGLKIVSAATGTEIADASVEEFSTAKVAVLFSAVDGPGEYHLYFGAAEDPFFAPSDEWLEGARTAAASGSVATAEALRVEARCEGDSFYPMEIAALEDETRELAASYPDRKYLIFPEDRDRIIKMIYEIPASWAAGPVQDAIALAADRNEYRVFQLGLWAKDAAIKGLAVEFSDLAGPGGTVIEAASLQCLTVESRIRSKYIEKPQDPYTIPKGQVRALWCGINIPENAAAGTYNGFATMRPTGLDETRVAIKLEISDIVVPEKGDHDIWRMSRLRWLESDAGLSDKVYAPFTPIKVQGAKMTTVCHEYVLNEFGLPASVKVNGAEILARPVMLTSDDASPSNGSLEYTSMCDGAVEWRARADFGGDRQLEVRGRLEYDGAAIIDAHIRVKAGRERAGISGLAWSVCWKEEFAGLASGMGYRGRRDTNRVWRRVKRGSACFDPSLWLGTVRAGLGWATWDESAWEDPAREDAAHVRGHDGMVEMLVNLGSHILTEGKEWHMQSAFRPTPVKPPDARHWQFRYFHRGGDLTPLDDDTPHSYLADDCRRLKDLAAMNVKRLNLHDWWGNAFNYPWQWERPDNLSKLTEEAHKLGIFVKAYNSGREFSSFAPEFTAMIYEGNHFDFDRPISPDPEIPAQDAWQDAHLPDGLSFGWQRIHPGKGTEHSIPVSNSTRIGNFYLEGMRYMTRFYGTDGAYWDGADGITLGHREMAKRLFSILRETNPNAVTDVHHGNGLTDSPITSFMFCMPFMDSLWHGEGFPYDTFDPWQWLVEISGLPFGVPSEMLGGEAYFGRGMLFGIWPRMGWNAGSEKQSKLWKFFDEFDIAHAEMLGFWEPDSPVTVDRPETYATAFAHKYNGVLIAVATWHPAFADWQKATLDATLYLDRKRLNLPAGELAATDIFTGEELDIRKPLPLPDAHAGRLIWVRRMPK